MGQRPGRARGVGQRQPHGQAEVFERGPQRRHERILAAEEAVAAGDVQEDRVHAVGHDARGEAVRPPRQALQGEGVGGGVGGMDDQAGHDGASVGQGHAGREAGPNGAGVGGGDDQPVPDLAGGDEGVGACLGAAADQSLGGPPRQPQGNDAAGGCGGRGAVASPAWGRLWAEETWQPADKIPPAFERRCIRAGRFASAAHTVKKTLHYVMCSIHCATSRLRSALLLGRIALLFTSRRALPARRLATLGARAALSTDCWPVNDNRINTERSIPTHVGWWEGRERSLVPQPNFPCESQRRKHIILSPFHLLRAPPLSPDRRIRDPCIPISDALSNPLSQLPAAAGPLWRRAVQAHGCAGPAARGRGDARLLQGTPSASQHVESDQQGTDPAQGPPGSPCDALRRGVDRGRPRSPAGGHRQFRLRRQTPATCT